MRFKYRRLMKRLNMGIYVLVFLLIAAIFWHISSGKKAEVRQITSSDINTNKIERIVSLGQDSDSKDADNEDSKEDLDADDEDVESDDLDSDDIDDVDGDDSSSVTVNSIAKDGDTFVVNLEDVIDFVNIRSEANADSSIVGRLTYGAGGTVVKAGDEWSEITSGGITGYVKNEFCLFGENAEKKIEEVGGYVAVINEDGLKVRSEKSTESSVLGQCGIGTEYNCDKAASDDEWVCINYEGQIGYVSAAYVTVSSKVATAN